MQSVPKLKKKKHDWSKESDDGIVMALFWDKVADPGDMDALFLDASNDVTVYDSWIHLPSPNVPDAPQENLRPLDLDFGAGIKALWSDEAGTITAFVFSPGMFNEESAQEWLNDAKNLTACEFEAADAALALTSFGEIQDIVNKELTRMYTGETPGDMEPVRCWIFSIGPERVVFNRQNGPLMVADYIIVDGEALIDNVREVTSRQVFTIKGTGEEIALSGEQNVIYAFTSTLRDGAEAEEADDGLVWKEIIHPGQWFKTGSGKEIEVTNDIINEAVRAFNAGMPRYVSIPSNHHHLRTGGIVPVEENRGFVRKIKKIGARVFGGMDIKNADTLRGINDGSIADCSVYIQPGAFHNSTGEKFNWIFRHVLLTNDPLVNDLSGFGAAIPASGSDAEVYHFHQMEVTMPDEITMSSEQAAILEKLEALDLSAEDVVALAGQREAIAAQAAELRAQKRDLEIACIVNAMQGKGAHPLVTPVEGVAHYPVVASAVEAALKGLPEALALDADSDGATPVDAVVMGIVNAIPVEGRIALNAQPNAPQAPLSAKKSTQDLSDEEFDAGMAAMGL